MSLAQRLAAKRKGLTRSPFQIRPSVSPELVLDLLPKITKELVRARMLLMEGELTAFKEEKLKELDVFVKALEREVSEALAEHIRTRAIEIRGESGYSPIKGKDYFDGKTPIVGIDFPIPKDGKTPTSEELLSIIKPLIPLPIKGDDGKVPTEEELRTLFTPIVEKMFADFATKIRRPIFGGGGDVVEAGSGITITRSGGKRVIASTGSGITFETPTGTVDGSNNIFTVLNTPKYIIVDGVTYFENNGYTIVGLTITTSVPPTGFIRSAY